MAVAPNRSVAAIRFFGEFELFAAISAVTAEKLGAVHARIEVLQSAPDATLHYNNVAELAHATDNIVVSEIETGKLCSAASTLLCRFSS